MKRNGMGKWLVITVALMLALWACSFASAEVSGSGTSTSPWEVTTWGELNAKMETDGFIRLKNDITAGSSDSALIVPSGKTVTLDLNGKTLSRGLTVHKSDGNVITVNGTLTVKDSGTGGKITGGYNAGKGGGVFVDGASAVFNLNSGMITQNSVEDQDINHGGGGVFVNEGRFNMTGGKIASNTVESFLAEIGPAGGGVYLYKGTFQLSGGVIADNTANFCGGVYVGGGSNFTMSGSAKINGNTSTVGGGIYIRFGNATMTGGTITGNTAVCNTSGKGGFGGGVYCNGGVMMISDKAEISGNTAKKHGAGVYVNTGSLTMTDGSIRNNQAEDHGGGICLGTSGTLTMTGGIITGNTAQSGGGISQEVLNDNRITVSGIPTISGNTASNQNNNLSLAYNKQHILVSGELTGGTIGVGVEQAGQVVAEPTGGYTITESDAEKFSDDNEVLSGVMDNGNVAMKKLITEAIVTTASVVYNGENQIGSIDVTVKSGKTVLTKDTDYTLSFEKDGREVQTVRDAGEYTVIVTGMGDYGRSVKSSLTVEPKEVGLIWSGGSLIYNGKEQAPIAEATELAKGDEVFVTVSGRQTDAGKKYTAAAAALTGAQKDNYKLPPDNTFAFSIEPKAITGATVLLDKTQLSYTGTAQSVTAAVVIIDGIVLTADDYTVSGNTGTEQGSYTLTVEGKGNFRDTATAQWQIVEKAMTVSVDNVAVPYDGQPHGITVNVIDPASSATVKYGTAAGTYNLDASPTITEAGALFVYFKVSAKNYNDYNGSAVVIITATDQPEPPAPEPTPEPVSISGAKISIDPQEYTGKAVNPKKISVTLKGTKLIKGTDYTVAFSNNKNIGKATATITGVGNYTGTETGTFSIVPKQISSASLKYRKKDNVLVFSWKKAAGGIDGYEIEYGTDKTFKGAKKAKVSAKEKKTEYKISKPEKKKTYYVRIRAWKKVKGKKYYSEWKVVSKKIK